QSGIPMLCAWRALATLYSDRAPSVATQAEPPPARAQGKPRTRTLMPRRGPQATSHVFAHASPAAQRATPLVQDQVRGWDTGAGREAAAPLARRMLSAGERILCSSAGCPRCPSPPYPPLSPWAETRFLRFCAITPPL